MAHCLLDQSEKTNAKVVNIRPRLVIETMSQYTTALLAAVATRVPTTNKMSQQLLRKNINASVNYLLSYETMT